MKKTFGVLHILSSPLVFFVCVALTSFSNTSAKRLGDEKIVTDSCKFLGATLRLIQEGDSAYLEAEDPNRKLTGKLKITPPCYFLRSGGKLETYAYKNIGVQGVLMVIGKIANTERKKIFGALEEDVCGEEEQGVLFKKKNIVITNKIHSGGLTCKDYGTDEKDFWDFAYRGD